MTALHSLRACGAQTAQSAQNAQKEARTDKCRASLRVHCPLGAKIIGRAVKPAAVLCPEAAGIGSVALRDCSDGASWKSDKGRVNMFLENDVGTAAMGALPLSDKAFDGLGHRVAFIGQNDVARVGIDPRIGWNNEFKFAPERRGVNGPAGVNGLTAVVEERPGAVAVEAVSQREERVFDVERATLNECIAKSIFGVDLDAVEARDAEGEEDAARSAAVLPE